MIGFDGDDLPPIEDPYPWPSVDADVSLAIVGDVNLQHRSEPSRAFQHVQETLEEFDIRYGNLEGCLHEPGSEDIPDKDRWQHSDEEMVSGLTAAGFDAMGGANNVNYGEEAVSNTVETLERAGIEHCGIGRDLAEARNPVIVSHDGTTLGFLQWTARYYGREAWATEDSPGVAGYDPEDPDYLDAITADVAALREDVDVLVFSHHLRMTSTIEVKPYQRELARAVIDVGADLVFGHGAHNNQEIEIYDGVPILHCIGQFAFDWPKTRLKRDGLLLRVHVSDGRISRLSVVPVTRDKDNNVYLTGPNTQIGHRQLAELQDFSSADAFTVNQNEAVVQLPER